MPTKLNFQQFLNTIVVGVLFQIIVLVSLYNAQHLLPTLLFTWADLQKKENSVLLIAAITIFSFPSWRLVSSFVGLMMEPAKPTLLNQRDAKFFTIKKCYIYFFYHIKIGEETARIGLFKELCKEETYLNRRIKYEIETFFSVDLGIICINTADADALFELISGYVNRSKTIYDPYQSERQSANNNFHARMAVLCNLAFLSALTAIGLSLFRQPVMFTWPHATVLAAIFFAGGHFWAAMVDTRVSSREQADNLSLGTQLKGCNQYAERLKYKILAQFGGTYESAENDERKEFIAMLAFVKKAKEKVSYILVYSLERFSRNDNSIWLSGELRKLGIEIVSVTQPIDTSSASGQMQQKMLFLFGEFDNQLRKQKCTAGIKEMLLRGDWPTAPPLGFDIVRSNGVREIVVNDKGKLLRQAYGWKSQYNLSNEAIRGKLAEKGLKLNHQRISEIFRNPFYCGLMAHNMLEGRVIEGNQEKLVSKATFLKVNGILDQNAHGYSLKEENEAIPLKRFTKCAECGKPLTGYLMRKKNIHYYKCKTRGCNTNKNAKSLNETFYNLLNNFTLSLDHDFLQLIRQQAVATFNQLFKGEEEAYASLANQYKELKKKIDRLEERYIEEELNGELYNKFSEKYLLEKDELEGKILKASKKSSNLGDCIDISLEIASKMAEKWVLSDYITKQKIQSLVFPDGITFSKKKEEVRTPRINFLFLYVAYFQQIISNKKSGIPELNLDFAAFACLVAHIGQISNYFLDDLRKLAFQ